VSFIKGRLRRLEGRMQGGRCPECGALSPDEPGRIVLIDDGTPAEGFPDDPEERCSRCDRPLWTVVNIIYGDEEGGGLS
jgi:hypothetical protein